jgi:AI-2 transport protein TqsA
MPDELLQTPPVEFKESHVEQSTADMIVDVVQRSDEARADLHVQTVCLLILAFLATGVGLWLLRPVLVPFVMALFFAACLKPAIQFQTRNLRAPKPVAVAGAIILALAILAVVGIPLASSVHTMWPTFKVQFDHFVASATEKLPLQRFGLDAHLLPNDASAWTDSISTAFVQAGGIASKTFLVIVFTLFILLGRPGETRNPHGVLDAIESRVQRYIGQMVFLSAVAGVLVALTLALCRVQFAAMFGFLAFLLNFIPTIGSIIATLLPLPIILLSPDISLPAKVCALVIPAVIQIWLGNAVQPRMLGNALDLHPIVILISLIFWSLIWGVPGAFLATPMTAVLRIVLEKIPATRPLAELLAGRLDSVF